MTLVLLLVAAAALLGPTGTAPDATFANHQATRGRSAVESVEKTCCLQGAKHDVNDVLTLGVHTGVQHTAGPPSIVGPDMATALPTTTADAPGRQGHTEQPVTNSCPVLPESTTTATTAEPAEPAEESESHTMTPVPDETMNGTCHPPPSPLQFLVNRAIKSVVSVYNTTQGGSETSSTKLLLLEDTPGDPPASRPRGAAAGDDARGRVAGTAKDLVAEVQADGAGSTNATFTAIVEAETRQLQSPKQSVAVVSATTCSTTVVGVTPSDLGDHVEPDNTGEMTGVTTEDENKACTAGEKQKSEALKGERESSKAVWVCVCVG